ncbi:hypothetical protein PRUB_a3335 [Pseudoalteromonas rubra]|uniref:Uncharacterized protein n=2 Tax=Pseudoalteromonas rubra TaxID=43658 RepID=A0A8T0C2L0_9GAMM|nr:hypothetical protein PRUB_a3335 [Pseudoalteromonas rubra]
MIFVASMLTLAGCGIAPCIDAQFERKPKVIDKKLLFELELKNGLRFSRTMKCERYYDAMCAARGNSWQLREVGSGVSYKRSSLEFTSATKERLELYLPECFELLKRQAPISLKDFDIIKNGERFYYAESHGNLHVFQSGGYKDIPLHQIKLSFSLKLNGKLIK